MNTKYSELDAKPAENSAQKKSPTNTPNNPQSTSGLVEPELLHKSNKKASELIEKMQRALKINSPILESKMEQQGISNQEIFNV